jgi:outer membrane protein assembly factor BamB
MVPSHRWSPSLLSVSLAIGVALLMIVPAGAYLNAARPSLDAIAVESRSVSSVPAVAASPGSSAYDWPELHYGPNLDGNAPNTTLSTSNASSLGVRWATELYGQAIDSPVVAYDPLLGETLVYIGTETGYLLAIDLANGQIVWSIWLGSPVVASPAVSQGSVYAATQRNTALFDINATTGSVTCTTPIPLSIESTPTVATPPGGVRTVYIAAEEGATSGPVYAIDAGNCSIEWAFTNYSIPTGPWDPISFGLTVDGVPLVLAGGANPDSTVYAINALTGTLVWHYKTVFPTGGNYDIGAGITVTEPGVNGFHHGAAYVINKYGSIAALNLSSGRAMWKENINTITGGSGESRSTPAVLGNNLVLGMSSGIMDLNAKNGALLWHYVDPSHTETIASVAIAGSNPSTAVVIGGDLGGDVDVLSLSSGAALYTYHTGGYITGSPAVSNGNILIDSTDSLLYDFAVGGGNDGVLPATSISTPAYSSTLANPTGPEVVHGNATDPSGVAAVEVAIESGGPGGPWWDAATGAWMSGPYNNVAVLASPGAAATSWTFSFPVPKAGGAFTVTANAVSVSGQTDYVGAIDPFAILPSTTGPHLTANPTFVAPGGTTTVNGGGFAHGELVTITYLNTTLGTEMTTSTGYLPDVVVQIPATAGFGLSALNASGGTSHKSATVAIDVLNDWDQVGYNATHTGSEPNDPTFFNLIAVGTNNFIHLAWNFVAGAPINASPVVANDVAYIADTAGIAYAVAVHNGGILWTWNGSGGSPLLNTSIDPSQSLLFVTAANGELYAISTVTGLTVWSSLVGGTPTAPVFAYNGVFVASSTGAVDRFQENTGTLKWSVTLASGVSGAPAINLSGKLVMLGEWNGEMVALSTANGTPQWTFATGGAIRAAATVYDDLAMFGSDDHSIYALYANNGTLKWKLATSAPVRDTGALTVVTGPNQPLLAIGTKSGELLAVKVSNGAVSFHQNLSGSVVGVGVAEGMIIAERATGLINGIRNYLAFGLYKIQTTAWLASTPVVVDGTIYVTTGSGDLFVYTPTGQPPI